MIAGKSARKLLISGGALLGFVGLLWLLVHRQTVPFDRSVSRVFLGLSSPLYLFFSLLCRTGNVEVEIPLLLYGGIRFYRRAPGNRDAESTDFRFLVLWATALVTGTLLEHFLKGSLPAFAPGRAFRHDPLKGWAVFFPLHVHVHASFPSGHTFRALMIVLLVRRLAPRYFHPFLLWAGGIMLGVVILGWHFATDVLGSTLLVLALSPWILASFPDRRNK